VETVGFTVTSVLSVEDGEAKLLKILIFATSGEKGFFRDSFVIFMPNGD
tara:strand:- start:52 stop:198 length:147 start_codon:yes stop_codon:yes gene_type:complete